MYIKVYRRDRPDCVKVINNNVTINYSSALFQAITDALKYWEELDRNAVRLESEDLSGTK